MRVLVVSRMVRMEMMTRLRRRARMSKGYVFISLSRNEVRLTH